MAGSPARTTRQSCASQVKYPQISFVTSPPPASWDSMRPSERICRICREVSTGVTGGPLPIKCASPCVRMMMSPAVSGTARSSCSRRTYPRPSSSRWKMMMCPAWVGRYAAIVAASGSRAHQGAANSPWKNTAPSSFTALSTSDSTSIGISSARPDAEQSHPDARINELQLSMLLIREPDALIRLETASVL